MKNISNNKENKKFNLSELGFSNEFITYQKENNLDCHEVGRVTLVHKDRYIVVTESGEVEAEILGSLRFTAESNEDFPVVGDWVAISRFDDEKAIIHKIFLRKTVVKRRAANSKSDEQLIAANVDYALIVQAVNRDFNLNRIERYLTICYQAKVNPIIVISKTDLIDKDALDQILSSVSERVQDIPIITISNATGDGIEKMKNLIQSGKTYCLLGSSGVGKSTLINSISNDTLMKTDNISSKIDRGKHVTTHRELVVLKDGGVVIDNPGMREIGMTENSEGLEMTFDTISQLSEECKFIDCTHLHEPGCAVREGVDSGLISEEAYENYQKLIRERNHYESSKAEKKKKGKDLAKLIKNMKKIK